MSTNGELDGDTQPIFPFFLHFLKRFGGFSREKRVFSLPSFLLAEHTRSKEGTEGERDLQNRPLIYLI